MNFLVPLASIALPYIPWLIVICVRIPRYGRALQSVDYNAGRYLGWWLKNRSELWYLLSAVIVLPAVIAVTNYIINNWQQDSFYLVLLIANLIFAIALYGFAPRHHQSQQLKITGRTLRVVFIAAILAILPPLLMIATYAANLNDPFWNITFWNTNAFRYTVNAVCAAMFYAVPIIILLANLLISPIEMLSNTTGK